jgi:glycosyltransferase involved in cell wall biosynthesis
MKISILLPTFNTAPYLADCLDSILAQTEQDWELIAVNNFSTDASPEILQAYADRDPRIRFFHNDDELGRTGVSPANRFAYRKATGQLITRMDSDDIMPPDRLFLMKKMLLEHGLGHVATGAVRFFGEDGVGDGFRKYETWLNELAASGRHFAEIYRENVLPSPVWMAWREDLVRAAAFTEDVYPEDYDLTFRLRHAGYKIVATTELPHRPQVPRQQLPRPENAVVSPHRPRHFPPAGALGRWSQRKTPGGTAAHLWRTVQVGLRPSQQMGACGERGGAGEF